jgi:hypothetical protein
MAEGGTAEAAGSYEIYLYIGVFTPGQFMLVGLSLWHTLPIHVDSTYY